DGVGEHEGEDHARVVDVAHVEVFAQNRRRHRERLAVEVVDDGGPEGKRDHQPASRGWRHEAVTAASCERKFRICVRWSSTLRRCSRAYSFQVSSAKKIW